MDIRQVLWKTRCFCETHLTWSLAVTLTGLFSLVFCGLLGVIDLVLDLFPVSLLELGIILSITVTLAGVITLIAFILFTDSTRSVSPEEYRHIKEQITALSTEIAALKSAGWKDIIISRLGKKARQITSEQYLIDEKNFLIQDRLRELNHLEARLN